MALVELGRRARARIVASSAPPTRPRRGRGAARRPRARARLRARARGGGREAAAAAAEPRPGRARDLTALPTFTVDPASARDFDDAVSAERDGDGIRLWIHIADVAAHVRPGSGARARGAARARPAPTSRARSSRCCRRRSRDACSLAPGVERLAVTAEIELAATARPRSASFYRSRIRSDARLDYDQLDEIFAGRAAPPRRSPSRSTLARRAAAALAERARGGGARGRDRRARVRVRSRRATSSPRARSRRPRRTG